MDLTWTFYQRGYRVRFVPEAVCYPIEPHTFTFMRKQLKRWSHGFVQNVRLHWSGLLDVPYLRTAVAVGLWDATIASLAYLVLLPLLALALGSPLLLLGYVIDVPMLLVPVLTKTVRRKECGRALASIPAFFVLRLVNGLFFLEALWTEWVLRRSFRVYEKGH
jgi:biofilm PGA synthesis N-glycosyltransferase PgaC